MARKPRFAPPHYALHVTQRGNYRQPVFFTDEDRNQFPAPLNDHADDRRVLVHGHTLMSNHLHLVVTGQEEGGVSRLMQHVTGPYAQYLHGRLNRRGRLWQSRFDGLFRRDTLEIAVLPRDAPPGQGFVIHQKAALVTLNSVGNEQQAVNAGWAVDWTDAEADGNRLVLKCALACRDVDGILWRVGYHATVIGRFEEIAGPD